MRLTTKFWFFTIQTKKTFMLSFLFGALFLSGFTSLASHQAIPTVTTEWVRLQPQHPVNQIKLSDAQVSNFTVQRYSLKNWNLAINMLKSQIHVLSKQAKIIQYQLDFQYINFPKLIFAQYSRVNDFVNLLF